MSSTATVSPASPAPAAPAADTSDRIVLLVAKTLPAAAEAPLVEVHTTRHKVTVSEFLDGMYRNCSEPRGPFRLTGVAEPEVRVILALADKFGPALPALKEIADAEPEWPATDKLGPWGALPPVEFDTVKPLLPSTAAPLLALLKAAHFLQCRAVHGYVQFAIAAHVLSEEGYADLEAATGQHITNADVEVARKESWFVDVEDVLRKMAEASAPVGAGGSASNN